MTLSNQIEKPKTRGRLRKFLGKEFFVLKRRAEWLFGNEKFVKIDDTADFEHSLIKHKSFLLRPLKGVDMYLQHTR